MPEANKKEMEDIKSGVEGVLTDVPEPSGEVLPETTEMPGTTYSAETEEDKGFDFDIPEQYSQQPGGAAPQQIDAERVHEIIEAVVNEKWDEMIGKLGDVGVWKEKLNNDVVAIKQELVRTKEDFKNLQNAILGKVREYDSGIRDVHTEMKALEKVFERILEPLTANIKDLSRLTEDLKKIKK